MLSKGVTTIVAGASCTLAAVLVCIGVALYRRRKLASSDKDAEHQSSTSTTFVRRGRGSSVKSTLSEAFKHSPLHSFADRRLSILSTKSKSEDDSAEPSIKFTVMQRVAQPKTPKLGTLQPELYRYDNISMESPKASAAVRTAGVLYFSLMYNQRAETLDVFIDKALDLPPKELSHTADPSIKVYLLPDKRAKFQTKVIRKSLSPVFQELVSIKVPHSTLPTAGLQLTVFDFDRFSRHTIIGSVRLPDLVSELDLEKPKCFEKAIMQDLKTVEEAGELLFSLCYLPAAGRLTVTIIKARGLKAMDLFGTSDPYIKITVLHKDRKVKRKKSTIAKNTLNPVFNEAFLFDVPQDIVDEICVLLEVFDHDRIGRDEFIGCVLCGAKAAGSGKDHWRLMIDSSRRPVAQWHRLHENVTPSSSVDMCCNR